MHGTRYMEKDAPTLDHIVPVSKGGTNDEDNLVTSCYKCNQEKGNIMPCGPDDIIASNEIPIKYLPKAETAYKAQNAPQTLEQAHKEETYHEEQKTVQSGDKALIRPTGELYYSIRRENTERHILDVPIPIRANAGLLEVRDLHKLRAEEKLRRAPGGPLRPRKFMWLRIAIRRAKLKRRMRRMQWLQLHASPRVCQKPRHSLRGRDGRFIKATV